MEEESKKLETVVSITEETPEQTTKQSKRIEQKPEEIPWNEQVGLRGQDGEQDSLKKLPKLPL